MVVDEYVGRCLDVGSTPTGSPETDEVQGCGFVFGLGVSAAE